MAYAYIISRGLDPIFAITIGAAAAYTRIQREERDKGNGTPGQMWETLRRRTGIAWGEVWGEKK